MERPGELADRSGKDFRKTVGKVGEKRGEGSGIRNVLAIIRHTFGYRDQSGKNADIDSSEYAEVGNAGFSIIRYGQ